MSEDSFVNVIKELSAAVDSGVSVTKIKTSSKYSIDTS